MTAPRIAVADPAADDLPLRAEIEAAAMRVLRSGRFILGTEVEAFERELVAFLGVRKQELLRLPFTSCGAGDAR